MLSKTIKYNKGDIIKFWIAIVLALFAVSSSLIVYILPTSYFRIATYSSVLFIEVLLFLYLAKNRVKFSSYFLLVMMVLLMLLAIIRSSWSIQSSALYVAVICLCIIALTRYPVNRIVNISLYFMLLMYIVYAIATIISYLNPSIYINSFIKLFPDANERLIKNFYNQGGIAGLTSHFSTNGVFLASGLIISVARFVTNKKHINLFLIILFLFALLMCGKRAQLIFGIFSIFVLMYFKEQKNRSFSRWLKIIGFAVIFVFVGSILYTYFPNLFIFLNRFGADDVSSGRYSLWRIAITHFLGNPIFGIGWRDYMVIITRYGYTENTYDAHNIYIQILCETGIIGFSIFIAWFVIMYKKIVRSFQNIIKSESVEDKEKYLVSFSLLYQTFFLLYGMTGNPLYEAFTFIPYFMSCAIAIHYSRGKAKNVSKNIQK